MLSPFGVTIIKTFEKFEPRVYADAVGIPTIGYGHVVLSNESFDEITEPEAVSLLQRDVAKAEEGVDRLVPESHRKDNAKRESLVSWVFNLGVGALESSTLLKVLRSAAPDRAVAEQIIRWVHGNGERLSGLVRRRHCEAVWFLGAPDEVVLSLARRAWL